MTDELPEDLRDLHLRARAWLAAEEWTSDSPPFVGCGVDRGAKRLVVDVRFRDDAFENRFRSEVTDRVAFVLHEPGEYAPP